MCFVEWFAVRFIDLTKELKNKNEMTEVQN